MSSFLGSSGERFDIPIDVENITKVVADLNLSSNEKSSDDKSGQESIASKGPIVVLVIGMAGTGKTTLMHRLNIYMNQNNLKGYYINLDPAVKSTPFSANIDIRDTVNYKEVMAQYGLGPNGGILTSLNLFATRFDQVIGLLERRVTAAATSGGADGGLDYIFIDTPGQIEAFTWSAGGQIIQDLLGSSFPTCVIYVTDTTRCLSPTTFMSNMLYACSVLYKAKLPMICCFNKIDVTSHDFALGWMDDFEKYLDAIDADKEEYMGSFNRSLALAMDEFYRNITTVGVSAATGEGISELFSKIELAAVEFEQVYLPDLQRRIAERSKIDAVQQAKDLERLRADIRSTRGDKEVIDSSANKT